MASKDDFDFSAQVIMAGGALAERNWQRLVEHTVAEWSGDIDATMATITPDDPFQIMHATGLQVRGWQAVRDFYLGRLETFSGQGFFAQRWVVSDQVIVGNGHFSGAPSGNFFGVTATGKRLLLPMTIWIYFQDTLVKGEAAYLDGGELARQLRTGTDRDPKAPVF
jgi:predicted ester cyclase